MMAGQPTPLEAARDLASRLNNEYGTLAEAWDARKLDETGWGRAAPYPETDTDTANEPATVSPSGATYSRISLVDPARRAANRHTSSPPAPSGGEGRARTSSQWPPARRPRRP